MGKPRAVALHMTLNTNHRLEIAQGIVQYAREHPGWRLYGSFYTSQPVLDYEKWDGDGIISICHRREDAAEILATDLPIVDVVEGFYDDRIVYVTTDNLEAGRMGGRHLLSTGFRHFAFCGARDLLWSDLRLRGLAEQAGIPVNAIAVFSRRLSWWQNPWRSKALEKYLLSLPERTAILGANDTVGVKVTAACQHCGRKVPEDIAVLGIEGDNLLCELSFPPLSTIHIDGLRMGYEAARRLDAIMTGLDVSRKSLHLPPGRLMARASSDVVSCDDETVGEAVRFIRRNCGAPISVADVARHVAVCRRTLEIKFRRHLSRTVLSEIQDSRMQLARRMLEETDLPVGKILLRCGFMTHQFFYAEFRRRTRMTPAQYRGKFRRTQTIQ